MSAFTGIAEMEIAFARLGEAVGGASLEEALKAGGLLPQNRWKELAPVLTGTYRRSIHMEVLESSADRAVIAIGTDIVNPPYPVFLELGTSRMAARPSGQPAFDQTRAAVVQEIERVVGGKIGEVSR